LLIRAILALLVPVIGLGGILITIYIRESSYLNIYIFLYGLILFALGWWQFGPDNRFEAARELTLETILDSQLSELKTTLGTSPRFPIRVNIMKKRICLREMTRLRRFTRLELVFTYGFLPTEGDYGIYLPSNHGTAWKEVRDGRAFFFDRRENNPADLNLSASMNIQEILAGRHHHKFAGPGQIDTIEDFHQAELIFPRPNESASVARWLEPLATDLQNIGINGKMVTT
jgi:hypothetical protein